MRKIEAVIRKLKFKDVKIGLIAAGYDTFTYWAVRSVGEGSEKQTYKTENDDIKASERIQVNLMVRENKVEEVVNIIVESGQTHEVDDALILIFDLPKVYQIIGREKGDVKIIRI